MLKGAIMFFTIERVQNCRKMYYSVYEGYNASHRVHKANIHCNS